MSMAYLCDRCGKTCKQCYELNFRMAGLHPEAQYVPPNTRHLCDACAVELQKFMDIPAENPRKV